MIKVAIITLVGHNYGNRLQNYAVQSFISRYGIKTETIISDSFLNKKDNYSLKNNIKYLLSLIKNELLRTGVYRNRFSLFQNKRTKKFIDYNNKYISFSKNKFSFRKKINYDYFIVGSDQVWNPFFGLNDFGLLDYIDEDEKKIAFSASIGVEEIPELMRNKYAKSISKYKSISLREDKAKEIVEELTGRKDVEVLVDPTMLLTSEEWDKVSRKPKQLDSIKEGKYILNYFLGELSKERKQEIERIAKENNCNIINILDRTDPFYVCGPSEFLFLEKHAFLICTDSFHSSVFAILYDRPFIIFDREQKGIEPMNSRIETLISKFKLKDRKYNGESITKENLNHDYTEAYKILEKERKKSDEFLKKALEINK